MDICPELWNRRENGSTKQVILPRTEWPERRGNSLIQETGIYHWEPPYQLLQGLPDSFHFRLAYDLGSDGVRRFYPTYSLEEHQSLGANREPGCTTESLAFLASLGGYTILADRGEIDGNRPFTHDEARLFCQYAKHCREYIGDTPKLERAITICRGGEKTRDTKDILPDDLGHDSNGNGVRWSPSQLRAEGLRGASRAGIEDPQPDQVFRHGLLRAAMRNPLFVKPDKSLSLFRMTLFDLGPTADSVSEDGLAYVASYVKKSLAEHRSNTTEQFDRWLKDEKSNLITRISKRKDCHLDREHVRMALLELGWQAIEMLGRCIGKQMEAFCNALPTPLTEAEKSLFAPLYQGSPSYGNLPLVLLHERFDFLQEAFLFSWSRSHDDFSMAVVHRMMFYFSQLVGNRRASDRRYKQRANVRNARGQLAQDSCNCDGLAQPTRHDKNAMFTKLALRIAEKREPHEDFDSDDWKAELMINTDKLIEFKLCSERLQFDRDYCAKPAELKAAMKELGSGSAVE